MLTRLYPRWRNSKYATERIRCLVGSADRAMKDRSRGKYDN